MSEQVSAGGDDAATQHVTTTQSDDGVTLPSSEPMDIEREFASKELLGLLNEVERDHTNWIPNTVGESLMGTVSDTVWREDESTAEYGPYWIVVVETPSGRIVDFHAYHTAIAKNVAAKKASGELVKGSQIAISYRGEAAAKGKKSAAKMYNMALIPPTT